MLTACSDDKMEPQGPSVKVITFENTGIATAGPTSYGANLYEGYADQFTSASIPVSDDVNLEFGLNESMWTGNIDFYGGGMALSTWNYRTSPADQFGMWWYTYLNQCSVYNVNSTDGANAGAGADGSDTFALVFGYRDQNSMSNRAKFSFSAGAEMQVVSVMVCPTSFVYGNLAIGNPYSTNRPIKDDAGWFKILAYGFDAQGNATNGGNPVELYFCDYRSDANPQVELIDTWTRWNLSALGNVNRVEFDFEGSDYGTYGLNTPAYACIDNIEIKL